MALNILPRVVSEAICGAIPAKEHFIYTPCYCEENIWMMLKKMQDISPENVSYCYTVFISNEETYIPLWRQSASKREDGLVAWDYHVILVYCEGNRSWVFDFDTQLPFPTEFNEYCEETLKSDDIFPPDLHRYFRVIPAEQYLKYFSSDRRHMKNTDGTWRKSPPNYPPIRNNEGAHNLEVYISMKEDPNQNNKFGNVFNLNDFVAKFSQKVKSKIHSLDYMNPPEPLQPSWLE